MRLVRPCFIAAAVLATSGATCGSNDPTSPDGNLLIGIWGGENVSMSVENDIAHVHIGCTMATSRRQSRLMPGETSTFRGATYCVPTRSRSDRRCLRYWTA